MKPKIELFMCRFIFGFYRGKGQERGNCGWGGILMPCYPTVYPHEEHSEAFYVFAPILYAVRFISRKIMINMFQFSILLLEKLSSNIILC